MLFRQRILLTSAIVTVTIICHSLLSFSAGLSKEGGGLLSEASCFPKAWSSPPLSSLMWPALRRCRW